MSSPTPKVSLGMPVYNGERYLEEALESLLAQSFEDFEIVISDNASTDATEEICRTFARNDDRISYFRSDRNRGVLHNFNEVFRRSQGRYFKWAASDDVCGRDYLLHAVQKLDEDPSVVLVWAKTVGIDEQGARVRLPYEVSDLNSPSSVYSPDPVVRLSRLLRNIWWVDGPFYGVIRADALARTRWLHPPHPSGDEILLAELSLKRPLLRDTRGAVLHARALGQDVEAAQHAEGASRPRRRQALRHGCLRSAARVPRLPREDRHVRPRHPGLAAFGTSEDALLDGSVPSDGILGDSPHSSVGVWFVAVAGGGFRKAGMIASR